MSEQSGYFATTTCKGRNIHRAITKDMSLSPRKEETGLASDATPRIRDKVFKEVEVGNHGKWTGLETEQSKLTWSKIWKYTLLRSMYDVLPTPTNRRTLGLIEAVMSTLFQKPVSLEYK